MPNTLTFPYECAYRQINTDHGPIWMPYVDVMYEGDNGRKHRTSALVDSGAAWSSIPETTAIRRFHVDVDTCEKRLVKGISGSEYLPCQEMTLTVFGKPIRSTVLFTKGDQYLIGHIPIFSHFLFAFEENQQPGLYRLLYKP